MANSPRFGTFLLLLGALVGVLLAASGIGTTESAPTNAEHTTPLPQDAVARVNGRIIGRAEYDRALRALKADPRGRHSAEERALERLRERPLHVFRDRHTVAVDAETRSSAPYAALLAGSSYNPRDAAATADAAAPSEQPPAPPQR